MKILFCGLKYENGRPELGLSAIESRTFLPTLQNMPGVEVEFFPMDEQKAAFGREAMNKKLIERVELFRPDLLFCFLFTDEILPETIVYITNQIKIKTFNWFADDVWRFGVFSRYWAPLFTLSATTDPLAIAKYRRLGVNNVISTQWAADTSVYKPVRNNNNGYNITFVGKNYGGRMDYIQDLKKQGLPAVGFGKGWQSGILDFNKMLKIFSASKINLNFTENYFSWPRQLAKLFIKKENGHYRLNIQSPIANLQSLIGARQRQMKARMFEVPACGGFLMTGDAPGLPDYYRDGKEIVVFKDKKDLAEKCRYYLAHEEQREAIAEAGYQRTLKEHTYTRRFTEIFKALGFIL